jgi:hypothetical protein
VLALRLGACFHQDVEDALPPGPDLGIVGLTDAGVFPRCGSHTMNGVSPSNARRRSP